MSAALEVDGRNRRKQLNRARIIEGCRRLMLAGDFRPTVPAVAKSAELCVRSVYEHFGNVETLYTEALDEETRRAIGDAIFVPGADLAEMAHRSVHAAVFGTLPPPLTMRGELAGGGAL